jgi:hypothetical protein
VDERAANVLLDLLVASQPEIEVGDARAWVSNIVGALPWEAGKQWAALRMLGHYLAICKTQPKPAGILSHAISRVSGKRPTIPMLPVPEDAAGWKQLATECRDIDTGRDLDPSAGGWIQWASGVSEKLPTHCPPKTAVQFWQRRQGKDIDF